jgi:16S rRNA processing protein RimM
VAESRQPAGARRAEAGDWDDLVLVGRIARPHGLRGDVAIAPETDFVEERFTTGAAFRTRSTRGDEELVIGAVRIQQGRPIVRFDGIEGIDDAQRLSGLELRIAEQALQPLEAGTYYHHQLIGCRVETVDGRHVGEVARVDGGAAGALLAIDGPRGEILIPLAVHICVEVEPASRMIRIAPPDGLLDLNETKASRPRVEP